MKKIKESTPSRYSRVKHSASIATVSLAVGAIIGVAAGLLTAPKKGKELQNDLEKDATKLWKKMKLTKKDIEKMIEETFGEVTPETRRLYTKAKSEVLARVVKFQGELKKADYNKIVDQVIAKLTKKKEYQKALKKLNKRFRTFFDDLV